VTALLLALGASLAWGVADFVGPFQARTLGTFRVLLWAQLGGLTAIALAVAVRASPPDDPAVLLAVPAAISGSLGLIAFYGGMVTGTMSVVAPIAGASAVVPVVFGIATGDRPSPAQIAGIGAALVGVVLAAQEHRRGERRLAAGVGLALLAMLGFGFYFPPMHVAGSADPWWASLVFRTTAFLLVVTAVLVRRPPVRVRGRKLAIVVGVGVGDAVGNLLFAASSGLGLVSLTSVLASLYPVVTVALAAVVVGERISGGQRIGVVLTLAGVALIAT